METFRKKRSNWSALTAGACAGLVMVITVYSALGENDPALPGGVRSQTVADRIKNVKREDVNLVRGNLSIEADGRIRITFTRDAYALVAEKDVDVDSIMPLARGEDPSGRDSKFALRLLPDAAVELHVGTVTHQFRLNRSERPFYIDEKQKRVVYIERRQDCAYECRKWVIVADVYCCGGGFTQGGFGYVGCADEWCDEDRCCD